jgi:hypothetical protein
MPSELVPSPVHQLLAVFPAPVRTLALSARDFVLATLPDAVEIPDAQAKLIGYGYGPGYKDMVVALILSKHGVKIGLVQGASLPDPAALLKGAGKVHRYIEIFTRDQLLRDEVRHLIEAALSSWRERSQHAKAKKPRMNGTRR